MPKKKRGRPFKAVPMTPALAREIDQSLAVLDELIEKLRTGELVARKRRKTPMNDINKNPNRHAKPKTLPTPKHKPSMRGQPEDEFTEHKPTPLAPQPIEMGEEAEVEAKRKEEMAKMRADAELAGMVALHMKSTEEEILDWATRDCEVYIEGVMLALKVIEGVVERKAKDKAAKELKAQLRAHEENMRTYRPARGMESGGGDIVPGPSGPHYPTPGGSRQDIHESIPVSVQGRPASAQETAPNWMRDVKDHGKY